VAIESKAAVGRGKAFDGASLVKSAGPMTELNIPLELIEEAARAAGITPPPLLDLPSYSYEIEWQRYVRLEIVPVITKIARQSEMKKLAEKAKTLRHTLAMVKFHGATSKPPQLADFQLAAEVIERIANHYEKKSAGYSIKNASDEFIVKLGQIFGVLTDGKRKAAASSRQTSAKPKNITGSASGDEHMNKIDGPFVRFALTLSRDTLTPDAMRNSIRRTRAKP
jgi:hypothetical protein